MTKQSQHNEATNGVVSILDDGRGADEGDEWVVIKPGNSIDLDRNYSPAEKSVQNIDKDFVRQYVLCYDAILKGETAKLEEFLEKDISLFTVPVKDVREFCQLNQIKLKESTTKTLFQLSCEVDKDDKGFGAVVLKIADKIEKRYGPGKIKSIVDAKPDNWNPIALNRNLTRAAIKADVNHCKKMLDLGACVNSREAYGEKKGFNRTPLEWACVSPLVRNAFDEEQYNYKEVVELLLARVADVTKDTMGLHLTAAYSATDVLDSLLKKGVDIEIGLERDLDKVSSSSASGCILLKGSKPLHIAVEYNKLDAAKNLIKAGANIEATDRLDRTPIFYATRKNTKANRKMIKLLIRNGADVTVLKKQKAVRSTHLKDFVWNVLGKQNVINVQQKKKNASKIKSLELKLDEQAKKTERLELAVEKLLQESVEKQKCQNENINPQSANKPSFF